MRDGHISRLDLGVGHAGVRMRKTARARTAHVRCVPFTCASYVLGSEASNDLLPAQSPRSAGGEGVVNAFGRKRRPPAAARGRPGRERWGLRASGPPVLPAAPPEPGRVPGALRAPQEEERPVTQR